jgi:hypothetical protein
MVDEGVGGHTLYDEDLNSAAADRCVINPNRSGHPPSAEMISPDIMEASQTQPKP